MSGIGRGRSLRSGTALGGLALAVAGAVFGWTLLDAVRVAELPAEVAVEGVAEVPTGEIPDRTEEASAAVEANLPEGEEGATVRGAAETSWRPARQAEPMRASSLDALLLAADNDPFRPDRRRPPQRYSLNPEPERDDEEEDEPEPAPALRVVGSAVVGDKGFALIQIEDGLPIALAVGESVLGYTLTEVRPQSAVMVGADRTLLLQVLEPLQEREQDDRRRRGRDEDRQGEERLERARTEIQQLQRLLQLRQIQQGQRGGGPGQRGRGGGGGEDAPLWSFDGSTVWIPAGGAWPPVGGGATPAAYEYLRPEGPEPEIRGEYVFDASGMKLGTYTRSIHFPSNDMIHVLPPPPRGR